MKKVIITVLFALINGACFSQALSKAHFMEDLEFLKKTLPVKHANLLVMNAVELKRNSNAIFIGEPTSGNINHYGEVRGFSLPKSKIVIAYSTKYWESWKGKKGPLKPDIDVQYSIKNYMDGKDEALMRVDKEKAK